MIPLGNDLENNLENLIARNQISPFSIYLVVILAVLLSILLLPIIKIDISSQSRGMIRSTSDPVSLISLVNGKVIRTSLYNNQKVAMGDTLLIIETERLQTEKTLNVTLTEDAMAILEDITLLINRKNKGFQTQTIQQDFFRYQTRRTELKSKIKQATITYNRYQPLYEKGVIARQEYEKYLFELQEAQQTLHSFDKQQFSDWENQRRELEEKIKNLKGAVQKIEAEEHNYYVTAPLSGTIEQSAGIQPGSSVSASQILGILSPADLLIVENYVSSSDIGLIQPDQKVSFQIDAFNYNQWGLLTGKVIEIDHNITLQEEQSFFKVKCALDTIDLQLKNGYKASVSKGMTLTSRFYITRRSLFDLLFDKVDNWLNPTIS